MNKAAEVCLAGLVLIATVIGICYLAPSGFGTTDLVEYWAAAKIFAYGGNPYDPSLMLIFEREGVPGTELIRMWNPPLVLSLIAPLSLFSFAKAVPLWIAINLMLLVASLGFCASAFSIKLKTPQLLLFLVTLYPIALTLSYGQISILLLFGLSGFFWFRRRGLFFLAGLALSITLIKPHLLYLVYFFLLLETIRFGNWKSFAGLVLGGGSLLGAAWIWEPRIIGWYLEATNNPPINFQTPSLGSLLQAVSGVNQLWVRLLPTIIVGGATAIWLALNFKKNNSESILFLLIALSLLTAPYGWTYDHVLLIPVGLWLLSDKSSVGVAGALIAANLALILWPKEWGMQGLWFYPLVFVVLVVRRKGLVSIRSSRRENYIE